MKFDKKITALTLAYALTAASGLAFSTSHYVSTSRLATGKWVKIAIPQTGIYEITDDELAQMGFNNPERVQVYGCGGTPIAEALDGSYPDDLQPVTVGRYNGKLCFLGEGPVAMSIANPRTAMPYYSRTFNPYSTMGYYFLHETNNVETVDKVNSNSRGSIERATSLGYYMHEKDITSVAHSGRNMLGEDILPSTGLSLPFNLAGIADTTLTVNVTVGANVTSAGYLHANLAMPDTTLEIKMSNDQARIYVASALNAAYSVANPVAQIGLKQLATDGTINLSVETNGDNTLSKLDKFIITYSKNNAIPADAQGQVRLGFASPSTADVVCLPGADDNTVVWNIDIPTMPLQYNTVAWTDSLGNQQGREFTPRISAQSAQYIAFDPSQTLMKVTAYEDVANQNLHSMPVPDMLIITDKVFMEQAQRIAQLHKDVDGLDVAVVDQQEVFNEFSSGTPDAMAYRMLCKMLYDRDKTKFKNLLLFGPMSYDNRGLSTNKANRLLSFQSEESASNDGSYVTNDIFGFLDDYSGGSTTFRTDNMRIGVGIIPAANVAEARKDVDKLIKYVANPDYGVWRNNSLIMADTGDGDAHIFEAEGVNNLVESELNTGLNTNKVYVDMFQRSISDGKTSSEARRRLAEHLNGGQYFATYVGHAGPLVFTKTGLWTSSLAQNTSYEHLPIMTTACCEVAEFDNDSRGIAEHMFHNPTGGAIALISTPRLTLNTENEVMNRNFVRTMFSYDANGYMPTLGEAFMKMKQAYGTASNGNKYCYTLMGDPLIKINYPKTLVDIKTVNGQAAGSDISVSPMQQLTITGQVLKEGTKDVDTEFNGDATITLYDAKRLLKSVTRTIMTMPTTRDIYYSRDVLAQVQGRVVNGQFTATVVVPRHTKALDETALLRVYAHQDGTSHMVNGDVDGITITEFDEQNALTDDAAPVIDAMYLNDEQSFAEGATVPASSMLYIKASDDLGLNTQMSSVGNTMKLLLDGGKTSYTQIKDNAVATDGGRSLAIALPLDNIQPGAHTLTFTVFDVAGNSASRTISFIVTGSTDIMLSAREMPATSKATIDLDCGEMNPAPVVDLKVTDAHGRTVWTRSTSEFPVEWDLKGNDGKRVEAGLYKVMGKYDNGANYGGTNIADLIVVDPVKTNK